jgi:hypothetical protein
VNALANVIGAVTKDTTPLAIDTDTTLDFIDPNDLVLILTDLPTHTDGFDLLLVVPVIVMALLPADPDAGEIDVIFILTVSFTHHQYANRSMAIIIIAMIIFLRICSMIYYSL